MLIGSTTIFFTLQFISNLTLLCSPGNPLVQITLSPDELCSFDYPLFDITILCCIYSVVQEEGPEDGGQDSQEQDRRSNPPPPFNPLQTPLTFCPFIQYTSLSFLKCNCTVFCPDVIAMPLN